MTPDYCDDERTTPLIRGIVRDDGLTRGLGDEEARVLVEWVVTWAELLSAAAPDDAQAAELVGRLGRRAQAAGRFVQLWADPRTRAAAGQLAATERFACPLPAGRADPADLMQAVLGWERG